MLFFLISWREDHLGTWTSSLPVTDGVTSLQMDIKKRYYGRNYGNPFKSERRTAMLQYVQGMAAAP